MIFEHFTNNKAINLFIEELAINPWWTPVPILNNCIFLREAAHILNADLLFY